MVAVHVTLEAWDACTPVDELTVKLVSVISNEPADDRGDGHAQPDMEGWDLGTADLDGELRAERSGRGRGREYALTYEVGDAAGNTSSATVIVPVMHDRAGGVRSRSAVGPRGRR